MIYSNISIEWIDEYVVFVLRFATGSKKTDRPGSKPVFFETNQTGSEPVSAKWIESVENRF